MCVSCVTRRRFTCSTCFIEFKGVPINEFTYVETFVSVKARTLQNDRYLPRLLAVFTQDNESISR